MLARSLGECLTFQRIPQRAPAYVGFALTLGAIVVLAVRSRMSGQSFPWRILALFAIVAGLFLFGCATSGAPPGPQP
jgi:hypothetical protein